MTTLSSLQDTVMLCEHNHPREFFYRGKWSEHMVLRGFTPWREARTKMAEPYPLALADLLAAACVDAAGFDRDSVRRLDPCRFGQAAVRRAEVRLARMTSEQLGAPVRPAASP